MSFRSYSGVNKKANIGPILCRLQQTFRRGQEDFFYHNGCEGDAGEVEQVVGSCFLRSIVSRVFEGLTECDCSFYSQVI